MVSSARIDGNQGMVLGDVFPVRVIVNAIPAGRSIAKAWLTVKAAYSDADVAAKIQKAITTTNSAGTGQIEDDGSSTQSAILRFDLVNADTTGVLTAGSTYYVDVQYKFDNGETYTIIDTQQVWQAEVTKATS